MDSTIRALVDLRDRTLQKNRIAFGNRLNAIERGADHATPEMTKLVTRWLDRFRELEDEADQDIARFVDGIPIIQELENLKGIGKLLAAKLVSMIDIERASTVSALWKYAGYGVTEGERDRPQKGEKLPYNKRLKVNCYLVGSSFLRANSPYRAIYDSSREYYDAKRPDWTKAHKHNAAMRRMIKIFLQHLWITWRQMEGLSINAPYVQDRLGHEHIYLPEDFGWTPRNAREALDEIETA